MQLFILNVINITVSIENKCFHCFPIDMETYVQILCTYTYVQIQDFFSLSCINFYRQTRCSSERFILY